MKKKRDVLLLCQFFYPEYISSALLPYDTVRALQGAGFSVDVLCGYPFEYAGGDPVPVRETIHGIGIQRVKYIQMDRKGFLGRLVNYFSLTFMMMLRLFSFAKYRAVIPTQLCEHIVNMGGILGKTVLWNEIGVCVL